MIPRVTLDTPRLLPVHLEARPKRPFHVQLEHLQQRLGDLVEWLAPAPIDAPLPPDASAVVVPDLSGVAYRKLDAFRAIDKPILVITSEFATVSMWDWEIRDFLRRRGVATVAPTSLQESEDICRALGVKETLAGARCSPTRTTSGRACSPTSSSASSGGRRSASGPCTSASASRSSTAATGSSPRVRPPSRKRASPRRPRIEDRVPMLGLSPSAKADALRLYSALEDDLDASGRVIAAGINCLNESASSTTTPCLAWNLLFEDRGLLWGCEADLVSMLTEFIVNKCLGRAGDDVEPLSVRDG